MNRAGAIAEEEGHHPNLALTWGRADVEIYTHSVDGLTESDFRAGGQDRQARGRRMTARGASSPRISDRFYPPVSSIGRKNQNLVFEE